MANPLDFPRDTGRELERWWRADRRKPLVLRGARQVGKSHLVRSFALRHDLDLCEANLEVLTGMEDVFASRDPGRISAVLEARLRRRIRTPGSLLFLDEVQACPVALASLRYFYEARPELPVIAAGSLLDFALAEPEHTMPVGRIEYLYVGPFTFCEYLSALGHERLRGLVEEAGPDSSIEPALHRDLLGVLREFLVVGGMPAAVAARVSSGSYLEAEREKQGILGTYLDDVAKYRARVQPDRVRKVFQALPRLVAQRFRYTSVDRQERARDLGRALDQLCMAGVAHRVVRSSASGIPLEAQADDRYFKVLLVDVGLVASACGIGALVPGSTEDLLQINAGAMAEQFSGQELLAALPPWEPRRLHYWSREERNSSAEVDYVVQSGAAIVPIEVKAGGSGRLRSIMAFAQEKGSRLAVRLWTGPSGRETLEAQVLERPRGSTVELLSLPLYMAGQVRRLVGGLGRG